MNPFIKILILALLGLGNPSAYAEFGMPAVFSDGAAHYLF